MHANGLLLCNSGVQVNGCCIDSAFYTIPKLKATFQTRTASDFRRHHDKYRQLQERRIFRLRGTPIISSKFIYGNAKSLLHSAVFFQRGMKTLDASLQGLSLACFLVDCTGFTDLKTEQLFYKPMTTVAGLDGLVLI